MRVRTRKPREESGRTDSSSASRGGRIGRRAAYSTIALTGGQLASMALAFVAVKLITNGYGLESYGIYSTAMAFTAIFALLADFGVNAVTSREVARRPSEADDIVPISIGLRLTLSSVVAPLVLGASFIVYPSSEITLQLGVGLIVITLISDSVRSVLYGFLTARGHNSWIAGATVLQQVLFVGSVAVSVVSGIGIAGAFFSYLGASLLTTAVVAAAMRRAVRIRPRVSLVAWRSLLGMAASIGTIQVVNLLYLRVDSLMLSVLIGPSAVALYAVAYAIISGASAIPGFLMTSLLPGIVGETQQGRSRLLSRAFGVLTFLGSLLVGLLLTAAPAIISIVSSSEFAGAALPLMILGVATFFTFAGPAFGYTAVVLNVHHRLIWVSLSGLVLNVGLNTLLIPAAGPAGAATATLICEAGVFVATVLVVRAKTGLRVGVLGAFTRSAGVVGLAVAGGALLHPVLLGAPKVLEFTALAAMVLSAGAAVLGAERLAVVLVRPRVLARSS